MKKHSVLTIITVCFLLTLRTLFRPLHGNFNPIRNIFRVAGQAAKGKGNDGTKQLVTDGTIRKEECCVLLVPQFEVCNMNFLDVSPMPDSVKLNDSLIASL